MNDLRSFIIVGSCSAFLLPLTFYLLYQRKRSAPALSDAKALLTTETKKSVDTISNFEREALTMDIAVRLNELLQCPEVESKYDLLSMLQQASAFSSNFVHIRQSECLDTMLSLLSPHNDTSATKRQNLIILQTLTNLVCDSENLQKIETHLDDIFIIGNTKEYSDQACAALQLFCNVALTPAGCKLLDNKLIQFYVMLETTDPYILRQVFSVLVNLSCDTHSCDLLLCTETPQRLLETVLHCLSYAVQPIVTIQCVCLLKNLYRCIQSADFNGGLGYLLQNTPFCMTDFLLRTRTMIRPRLQLLLTEPSSTDLTREMRKHTEELNKILETLDAQGNVN